MGRQALLVAVCVLLTVKAVHAGDGSIHGTVRDQSGLPVPGATVTLSPESGEPRVVITDATGLYTLEAEPGRYAIKAELAGFDTAERRDVVVGDEPVTIDFTLPLAALTDSIRVVAPEAPALVPPSAEAPQTIGRTILETAPLKTGRYDDVLPLLPNVVRGPDGLICVAGARAPQGSLLVNGVRETDPVTGGSGVTLPLEAVESVHMNAAAHGADLGGAVGGVTTVETRAGSDRFHVRVNSFTPRLQINHARITGIDAWEPNVGVSGPLVKGRLWFSEAVDYRFGRYRYDTLFGRQERLLKAFLSLSQIDARLSDGHTLSVWFTGYPEQTDAANVTAFTAESAAANARRDGWTAGVLDRVTLTNTSILETRWQVKRLDATVTPAAAGTGGYRIAPDRIDGAYYDRRDRVAYRAEGTGVYTHVGAWIGGTHTLKSGGSYGYVTFDGFDVSQPVEWRRTDGTLAQRETFVGDGHIGAAASEAAVFIQDSWTMTPRLAVDLGARLEYSGNAAHPVPAPRGAFTYAFANARTTISGAAGIYVDKLVLAAPAFGGLQQRVLQVFDSRGTPAGPPTTFANVLDGTLTLPKAAQWNLQVAHRLGERWVARVNYQERRGEDELVVTPGIVAGTTGALVLSSTGESRARSLETTVGYRANQSGTQAYVSYVRSSSRGNLNDLNAIEGEFKAPLVFPDEVGTLAADTPHRLLAWGVFRLPRDITVAQFFEWRTGFPYTALNENWRVVGARNAWRYPAFASLDLAVTKLVNVPVVHLPTRIGISIFNVTGRSDGRDVQSDIERPDFGRTYNPMLRLLRAEFEIVWGK